MIDAHLDLAQLQAHALGDDLATPTTSSVFIGTSISGRVSRSSLTLTDLPRAVTCGVTEITSANWSICHASRRDTDSVVTVAVLPPSVWILTVFGPCGAAPSPAASEDQQGQHHQRDPPSKERVGGLLSGR